jgi:MFS family permease
MASGWRSYSEPWYAGYATQGAVVLGTAPILIPLIVGQAGGAGRAGLVVAAFYLGQLAAPLWGWLTDRTGGHRLFYGLGYVLLAAGLSLFALADATAWWVLLALMQGAGAAATNTVAALFIVEFKPKAQWDGRIGWLQTFYGTGQAAGLGLAALLQASPWVGMLVSAGLMAPGLWLGLRGLPASGRRSPAHQPTFDHHAHARPRQAYLQLHHSHRPRLAALKHLASEWRGPFGLFILAWLLTMLGTWMIYNLYPLLMQDLYGLDAGLSSLWYAVGAGLGIFAYAPSGGLGRRWGDGPVVTLGVVMTLASLAGMLAASGLEPATARWVAPAVFVLMPVAWSPLIVAGTSLTAQLAPMPQGDALGVFNSTTAVGSVLGALLAGGLASRFGYGVVVAGAAVFTVAGLAAMALLLIRSRAGRGKEDGDGQSKTGA